jgi:hypothetical protein
MQPESSLVGCIETATTNISEPQSHRVCEVVLRFSCGMYAFLIFLTRTLLSTHITFLGSGATVMIIITPLQHFVRPWPRFRFVDPIHSRWDSLDGGSACHKASTYTQNNTDTE